MRLGTGMATCVGALLLIGGWASATTITFDEVAPQPIDGLTIEGVTFDYKLGGVDSTAAAIVNPGGPSGGLPLVTKPFLGGDPFGILTLDFLRPVTSFEFDFFLNTQDDPVADAVAVEVFDAALASLGSSTVDASVPSGFFLAAAHFAYTGAPVSRAVLDFDDAFQPINAHLGVQPKFGFDNLSIVPVPEPAASALLVLGLAVLAGAARRHRGRPDRTIRRTR